MADFGGTMRLTYNGNPLVMRGAFKHEPTAATIDGGTNDDGSIFRSLKPTGPTFDVTFQDSAVGTVTALGWDAIMMGGPYNVAVVEDDTGVLHTWANTSFTGRPSVDRMNGEVSGIKGLCPVGGYKRTGA